MAANEAANKADVELLRKVVHMVLVVKLQVASVEPNLPVGLRQGGDGVPTLIPELERLKLLLNFRAPFKSLCLAETGVEFKVVLAAVLALKPIMNLW